MQIKIFFYLMLLFQVFPSFAQSEEKKEKNWTLSGYVKNLQTAIFFEAPNTPSPILDILLHQRLNFKHYYGDHWKFSAGLRTRYFLGESVKLNPNYADGVDAGANDIFNLSLSWLNKPGSVGHSVIDRAYLEYSKNNWELRLGRQRINWGINTVWNPNDIFNAYSFTDFDYEERPGSDALLVRYYTGFASSLEFASKLTAQKEDLVIGILWKFNKFNYDFQFLSAYHKEDLVVGAGWAGNIKNASFKGEFSYFVPTVEGNKSGFAGTLGYEYQFENSLFLATGYLFNDAGASEGDLTSLFSFELSAKNLYPFKHALFVSASFPINPLINGGLSLIYSPNSSHPMFLNPNLTFSISDNWDLNLVSQIVYNKSGTDYASPFQALFLRLKYSF